ncbi:adenosylmethionine--8-amino-7-oxononanoate transaminase [Thalassomonas sp. M1454]|uniref:adenosylmethionine--8-amino-7-oxononanoate transaminase n=1 Tax=Thalassomonas sp. M1454 TaxID=2594477 RepID=UPI0011812562|nr:adenosylmethionine--8-amino-7-oxononanoate transaminase [Thalassomonas sp. M1454]TRX56857.1 adenosylmethionine--8-amino-7-oxononanoate transaminase [Thalassomonas sp. M1454]
MINNCTELLQYDQDHIWHPYTSMTNPLPSFMVESAKGVHLQLASGEKVIDGMSSWWSVVHGYNNPVLNNAIKQQVDTFSHVMFGGLTHEPAINLCKTLVELTPSGLDKVFLADSGSVAVEVAIKMALQYQHSKGKTEKTRLLTIKNGYHGDTLGAMSVCDPVNGMHQLFSGFMTENYFADAPQVSFGQTFDENDLVSLKSQFEQNHQNIAALILEPIVQGAGGMRFYHSKYLKACRELCDQYDVLLIADEIATGFGRTGKLFACEHANITPDILCLGKALTGGYMTLAATLCTTDVAETISKGEAGVFMHGPTFMGNPLACAAANASLKLLIDNNWCEQVSNIETQLKAELLPLNSHENVADVRVLGAIGVIEAKYPVNMAFIQKMFVENGVWIRPFGKLIYIMPPFVIKADELTKLTSVMANVIACEQVFNKN